MLDQNFFLYSKEAIYRFNRIVGCFSCKKGGPFRPSNEFKIDIFNDDGDYLGCVEFIEYLNGLYYTKIVAAPICYGLDSDFMDCFYTNIRLLFWLDSCWSRPKFVLCPICHEELDVMDELILCGQSDFNSEFLYKMLMDHMGSEHSTIELFGLKMDGLRVYLKTTLGNFEINNFFFY